MAELNKIINTFDAGEISPRLLMRTDLPLYNKAVKEMTNFYSLATGGVRKRRGTAYIAEVRDSAKPVRLIPFVANEATRFVLVFNDGYMQVIKNGAFVESSPGNRFELAVPYADDELIELRFAQSGSVMYIAHQLHFPQVIARVTDTNWTIANVDFTYYALSDVTFSNAFISFKIISGTEYFKVGTQFTITTTAGAISTISGPTLTKTEATAVKYATTGENLGLTGAATIDGRTCATNDRVLVKDQNNQTENGIYLVNTAGAWTRATDYDAAAEINDTYVEVLYGLVNGGLLFEQTETITTVGVDNIIFSEFPPVGNGAIGGVVSMPGADTTETWTIECITATPTRQEWSVTGSVSGDGSVIPCYWKTDNYPRAVAFYEQRLFFAGSPQFPQHIWGSAAGDFFNFTVGNLANDGLALQIAGNDYNAISHLVSARQLLVLTYSTEFSLAGPNNNAITGASSNIIKDHTRHGVNDVRPIRIGKEVLFPQRDGKKLRAISYSVTEDANVAPDITLFAEHVTDDGAIVAGTFSQNPDYVAWFVREDGTLLSLTFIRDYEITSWAQHTTDGLFKDVCTLPGVSTDDTYFVVERTINSNTVKYIETFDYDTADPILLDCAAFYDGVSTTTITRLSHLEGETVSVIVDGIPHPSEVVASGQITLDWAGEYVEVGLPYVAQLTLLNPEFDDVSTPTQARKKSIGDVVIRVHDTPALTFNKGATDGSGTLISDDIEIPFLPKSVGLDQPVPPYTGDKSVKALGWDTNFNVQLKSKAGTDAIILGVIYKAAVND